MTHCVRGKKEKSESMGAAGKSIAVLKANGHVDEKVQVSTNAIDDSALALIEFTVRHP